MKAWVKSAALQHYGGRGLELGEVFELRGLLNDEKLLKHLYCVEVGRREPTFSCDCGKEFHGEPNLRRHQVETHADQKPIVVQSRPP